MYPQLPRAVFFQTRIYSLRNHCNPLLHTSSITALPICIARRMVGGSGNFFVVHDDDVPSPPPPPLHPQERLDVVRSPNFVPTSPYRRGGTYVPPFPSIYSARRRTIPPPRGRRGRRLGRRLPPAAIPIPRTTLPTPTQTQTILAEVFIYISTHSHHPISG